MKALKIFLRVSGLLLVLAVGAVVVLTNLIDPNDYKPRIVEWVKQHTGRDLTLHGDIELAFFPRLGVKTGRFEVSNRAGFGPTPMLAVEAADLQIKLIPLLKRRLEVDTVLLNGPRVTLIRQADGGTNWDDLLAARSTRGNGYPLRKLRALGTAQPSPMWLAALVVQGVSIVDGQLSWDDRAADQTITLTALQLDGGKLVPGEPLDIALSVEVAGNALPEPATISLATTARVIEDFESLSLHDTTLRVTSESLTADLSMEKMAYALRAGLAALSGLAGHVNHASYAGHAGDGDLDTRLEIPSLTFNRADESLQVPSLRLQQGDFNLSGKVVGSGLRSSPEVDGSVQLSAGDLAELLQRNGLATDLAELRVDDVEAEFDFTLSANAAEVRQLSAQLAVNQQPAHLAIAAVRYQFDRDALMLAALSLDSLTPGDFSVAGAMDGVGVVSAMLGWSVTSASWAAATARGDVQAEVGDLAGLLERNHFAVGLLPDLIGEAGPVAASFTFDLVNNFLNLTDLVVESTQQQAVQSLATPTEVRISLDAYRALTAPGFPLDIDALLQARARGESNESLESE